MPRLTLDDLPAIMTLAEAAARVEMTSVTLRKSIKDGSLAAFIPRDRPPLRAGRGLGYRITRESLQSWYFGQQNDE